MDDNNISFFVKTCLPPNISYYKGTYTSDLILSSPELKINFNGNNNEIKSFIVNTLKNDDSDDKRGHWLALVLFFKRSQNKLYLRFFDSFAKSHKIYKEISKFIEYNKMECVKHNINFKLDSMSFGLQSFNSKLCGSYSSFCVISCFKNQDQFLNLIFSKFSRNRKRNDRMIEKFIFDKWRNKTCHNFPINLSMKLPLHELKIPPPFCPKKTLSLSKCFKKCDCEDCCHSNNFRKKKINK